MRWAATGARPGQVARDGQEVSARRGLDRDQYTLNGVATETGAQSARSWTSGPRRDGSHRDRNRGGGKRLLHAGLFEAKVLGGSLTEVVETLRSDLFGWVPHRRRCPPPPAAWAGREGGSAREIEHADFSLSNFLEQTNKQAHEHLLCKCSGSGLCPHS